MTEGNEVPVNNTGITRRGFIGGIAATAATYMRVFGRNSPPESNVTPSVGAEGKPEVKKMVGSTIVYSSLKDPEDIELANLQVEKQRLKSPKDYNPDSKHIANTLKWKSMVSEVCKEAKLSSYLQNNKEWLEKVMLGLIFAESKGDPEAGNLPHNLGIGLTQLEKGAVDDARERAKMGNNIDVWDPKTNIALAVHYLDKLFELYYNDQTLALWAYNLGIGNMNSAIKVFAREKAKGESLELEEIQRIFNAPYSAKEDYGPGKLARDYKMNAVNLSTSDGVRKGLRSQTYPILDSTYEYVPRIAAATQLLNAA